MKTYFKTKLHNAKMVYHVANAARKQQCIRSSFNEDGERVYSIIVNRKAES